VLIKGAFVGKRILTVLSILMGAIKSIYKVKEQIYWVSWLRR